MKNKKLQEKRRHKNLAKKKERRKNPVTKRRKGRTDKSLYRKMSPKDSSEDQVLKNSSEVSQEVQESEKEVQESEKEVQESEKNSNGDPLDESLSIEEMTLEQLKKKASKSGFRGYSKMKRAELLELLAGERP